MAIFDWTLLTNVVAGALSRGERDPLGKRLEQVWQLVIALIGLTLLGLIVMLVGQATVGWWEAVGHLIRFLGFLIVLIVAAFISGGGVGFIFGIPRLNADPPPSDGDDTRRSLQSNTNLERISDWLTNGIVAVALVKLEDLSGVMAAFGDFSAEQFDAIQAASIVAQCVVVSGALLGFIFGYIQTRTALALTFKDTEDALQKLKRALDTVDINKLRDPEAARAVRGIREAISKRPPPPAPEAAGPAPELTPTPAASAAPSPPPAPAAAVARAPAPASTEKFFTDD